MHFGLSNIITIGLNTSLEFRHLLDKTRLNVDFSGVPKITETTDRRSPLS
jgi:hypothetical protein